MKKKSKPVPWPEYLKNEVRLKLLGSLPEFEADVLRLRKEFGLPLEGLSSDEDYEKWDKSIEDPNGSPSFKELRRSLRLLGEKYNLPGHFYTDLFSGLFPYLTRNLIVPPVNNWVIEPEPEQRPGMVRQISIKTYAPLSKREIAHAVRDLARLQKYYFPKQITITSRIKKRFDRDLEIYKDLASRTEKPVRKEQYGNYLGMIQKTPMSSKKWREMKRIHKRDISIDYTEKTSRVKGREVGVKGDAIRKSLERIRKLMKELFGDSHSGQ